MRIALAKTNTTAKRKRLLAKAQLAKSTSRAMTISKFARSKRKIRAGEKNAKAIRAVFLNVPAAGVERTRENDRQNIRLTKIAVGSKSAGKKTNSENAVMISSNTKP